MLRLRNHFDCLVIGAGPSASVLAMTLSGWGRKVAMVELGRQLNAWDLDDVCDLDRPLLKRLGLGAAIRHAGTSCPRRRLLLWGDGRASEQKLEKSDYALRVDRELFDLDLRNMARALGVEVFGPARLESALPEDGRGMVEISLAGGKIRLRAETIVLACGRRLDPRLMPLVVEHSGPESLALQAPVRALGQRARVDAVEALPFGFLRWRSAGMPGAWGRVEVVIDRERQDEDPVEVIAEALEGSGIGFGEIELDDAGRREAGARLVGSRWPVFMAGSSAATLDPVLGRDLAAALADGENCAVAVNTAIESPSLLPALVAHERRRQEQRYREELAAALGLYLGEARFSDLPFWRRRHEVVRVEFESSGEPVVPERLRVAERVGRYQTFERRGARLETVIGWGLPGGPVKESVHRVPVEPLIGLVEQAEWTDDVVGLAAQEPKLFMYSRQSLLQALFELCRLGLLQAEPILD